MLLRVSAASMIATTSLITTFEVHESQMLDAAAFDLLSCVPCRNHITRSIRQSYMASMFRAARPTQHQPNPTVPLGLDKGQGWAGGATASSHGLDIFGSFTSL